MSSIDLSDYVRNATATSILGLIYSNNTAISNLNLRFDLFWILMMVMWPGLACIKEEWLKFGVVGVTTW